MVHSSLNAPHLNKGILLKSSCKGDAWRTPELEEGGRRERDGCRMSGVNLINFLPRPKRNLEEVTLISGSQGGNQVVLLPVSEWNLKQKNPETT